MKKKSSLGRGLTELLSHSFHGKEADVLTPESIEPAEAAHAPAVKDTADSLLYIKTDLIQPSPYQPRRDIDPATLQELADSIKSQGVLQPIVVRETAVGVYELVAGERRWRAAQLAGLSKVPAVLKKLSEEAAMAVALIENIQRENLNPMDEARALKRLADTFSATHQEVADVVGKSRTSITNLLRLMDLNIEVQHLLETGSLEMGHAKALLGLSGRLQTDVAKTVATRSLSVRETERLIKNLKTDVAQAIAKVSDPDIVRLEEDLASRLGAPVSIKHQERGKGLVVIRYHSLEELDGILAHIQ